MKFIEDEKREIIILSRNREEEDRARHSFVRARVQDLPQTPRGGEGRGKQIPYYLGAGYYRPESRRTVSRADTQ